MKAILKTLFSLFVTAVCLISDTATSSMPQVSLAQSLSVCSNSLVSNGPQPESWDYQSCDLRLETKESYPAVAFVPMMQ